MAGKYSRRLFAAAWAIAGALLLSSCGSAGGTFVAVAIHAPFEMGEQPQQAWSAKVSSLPSDVSISLALDEDKLYVPGKDQLTAFVAESGAIAWNRQVGAISAGMAARDGLVVVSTFDGKLLALDGDSGEERWEAAISGEVLAEAAIGGGRVLVQTTNGRVFAMSAEDGTVDWQQEYIVPPLTLHGTSAPTLGRGHVLVLNSSCKVYFYRQADGAVVWETVLHLPEGNNELERLVDADAQPVMLRQSLYAACHNGQLVQLEPATGDIVWKRDFSTRRNLQLKGNLLMAVNQASALVAHNAINGKVIWENADLYYRHLSDPVIWNDRLVVGDLEGYLHLFELEEGAQTGRIRAFGKEIRALLSTGDHLYALDVAGNVKAFSGPLVSLLEPGVETSEESPEPPTPAQ